MRTERKRHGHSETKKGILSEARDKGCVVQSNDIRGMM